MILELVGLKLMIMGGFTIMIFLVVLWMQATEIHIMHEFSHSYPDLCRELSIHELPNGRYAGGLAAIHTRIWKDPESLPQTEELMPKYRQLAHYHIALAVLIVLWIFLYLVI